MKYLIIYLEIEHMLNFLSQSEKGDFLDLMIVYAKNQEDPVIENKNVLNVFNFIRGRLDLQFEKARIKAEVARKNGTGGGRPPVKRKPKTNQTKPNQTQLVIQQEFEKIYRLYNSDKKIKVIPFDKLKNQFKAALAKVSVTELEENVLAYLAYLKTALWRKKKDFAAWINSSEFYANDWLAEIKQENNQIATQAKPISAADEWKSVIEKIDQQNNKQCQLSK